MASKTRLKSLKTDSFGVQSHWIKATKVGALRLKLRVYSLDDDDIFLLQSLHIYVDRQDRMRND